jgi:hypothetical protein
MDPLSAILIGSAIGLGKHGLAAGRAGRQKKVQAATTRWSPWTGMEAPAPEEPDLFGNLMEGVLASILVGKQFPAGSKAVSGIKPLAERDVFKRFLSGGY